MIRLFFGKIKRSCILLLIFAITVGGAKSGYAGSPISVETKVDSAQITLGDVVTFSIIVHHDPEMEVAPPEVNIKGFDFIESGLGKPSVVNGQIVQEYWFRLRADETGSHIVDPIPVMFTNPDPQNKTQKIPGQALTPKFTLEVQSVLRLEGEPKDIRDIKPLIPITQGWSAYYWIGLLLLAVTALAILLWKLRKRKPSSPARILPIHEQALLELESLKAKRLLEQGKAREHYFELSEIFRRYLGSRYSFPSLDWTTEEIYCKLQGLMELSEPLYQQAHSILKKADQVKFAKAVVDDHAETFASIVQFIQTTKENIPDTPMVNKG